MATLGRLAKIQAGAAIIWFVSIGIASQTDEIGFAIVFGLVLGFWVTTSLIQMALCVRFNHRHDGERSFKIGTLFLVISYVAIYLVPIRLVMQEIARTSANVSMPHWMAIIASILATCVLLSILQLVVAEAVVTSLVEIQQRRRGKVAKR